MLRVRCCTSPHITIVHDCPLLVVCCCCCCLDWTAAAAAAVCSGHPHSGETCRSGWVATTMYPWETSDGTLPEKRNQKKHCRTRSSPQGDGVKPVAVFLVWVFQSRHTHRAGSEDGRGVASRMCAYHDSRNARGLFDRDLSRGAFLPNGTCAPVFIMR